MDPVWQAILDLNREVAGLTARVEWLTWLVQGALAANGIMLGLQVWIVRNHRKNQK